MRKILSIFLVVLPLLSVAQFAPPAGQEGTTAMHADSSAFVGWATGCVVEFGPMNIANPSAGLAGSGWPAENATGAPNGTMGVTCLGDGGVATLTFRAPIGNGPGPDFAVFENGFKSGENYFLEIAFVEVSSDGENFFRFPAVTRVQTETQLGGFATMDPRQIHNFAGKYEAMYGTPFDLDDIRDNALLNKNHITHVRVIDVVGCIQPEYATYDSEGHPVNDPWPTPFASSGFDLDAVGVIHYANTSGLEEASEETLLAYPNPMVNTLILDESVEAVTLYSMMGQRVLVSTQRQVDVSTLSSGVYVAHLTVDGKTVVKRIVKQ
jgi:hypothetical protein